MALRMRIFNLFYRLCIKLNPNLIENLRPTTLPGRRVGNSTRLADYYIQKLFEVGNTRSNIRKIIIRDHYLYSNSGHEHLFHIIVRRIKIEHQNLEGKIKFDPSRKEIIWL